MKKHIIMVSHHNHQLNVVHLNKLLSEGWEIQSERFIEGSFGSQMYPHTVYTLIKK